ncbi:MAG: penicillin-binding transpeptidase domain-containing protein [Pseudomonadota bacterium]
MNRRGKQTIEVLTGRFYVLLGLLGLALVALLARAIDLQILRQDFYQHQGDVRHVRQVEIAASRGMIVDRNGEPLAISTPVQSVWSKPRDLLDHPGGVGRLARVLNLDADELTRRLSQRSEKSFVYVRRRIAPALAEAVTELKLPGVHLEREYQRFYPAGEVAAHVLGFTDVDDQGQEGLELSFDDWLRGTPGAKRVIRDRLGQTIENVEQVRAAVPGRDLITTLDRRLQYLSYRALKAAVMEFGARSGSAVVLEVGSGEVLAMVNQPSYNPNARSGRYEHMRNRAITDVFEPGSVIKPFAIAAALESGQYDPQSPVETAPGYHNLGAYTIRDAVNYGMLDLTGIITKSSNVGVSRLALTLDARHLWEVYNRFGFGEITGSGFPGESPGILTEHNRWREVEKAAVSYGYGLSTTPLQLAQAYAAIANGGRIRAPSFIKDSVNPDRAVLDPTVAAQIQMMMETVTRGGGTGTRAAVPHYRVAGKTGTSRKASAQGYNNRYVATFAGFAPASDPRVVVVVSINDPSSEEYYGGQIAAPTFRTILEGALRLMDVPPDDLLPAPRELQLAGEAP